MISRLAIARFGEGGGLGDIADKRRDINRSADATRRIVSPSRRRVAVSAADTKRERAEIRGDPRHAAPRRTYLPAEVRDEDAVSPRFRLENSTTAAGTALRTGGCGTTRYHLTNTRREPRATPPLLRPLVVPPIADPPRRAYARRAYPGTSDA